MPATTWTSKARTGTISRAPGLLCLLCLWSCAGAQTERLEALHEVSDGRYAMGTVLEATLHIPDAARGRELLEAVFTEASRLDALLSRHASGSELVALNERAGQGVVAVSPLLAGLVARAHAESLRTDGAFDPTVGPLVALWTEAARRDRLPDAEELERARARVGPGRVRVSSDGIALEAGSALDLGGIGKGFALDRLVAQLRGGRVERALLSFGQSSIWALGAPPDQPGWRLLVRAPEGGMAGFVTLRDQALSVSGSFGQGSTIEGRRFGHVIDPRSGWPLLERRQALVIAPDAALAEALSTALLVLGEVEGMALVEATPGCEGLLQDASGRGWETSGFRRRARFAPLGD